MPTSWINRAAGLVLLVPVATSSADARDAASSSVGRVRYVTDGDTFRLDSGERIRVAGIDAREIHADQARCRVEIERGLRAKAAARTILEGRDVRFVRVGRSYNRTVARVTVDGRDLAATLVGMGAARWWPLHAPKPDWCADRQ